MFVLVLVIFVAVTYPATRIPKTLHPMPLLCGYRDGVQVCSEQTDTAHSKHEEEQLRKCYTGHRV